MGSEPGNACLAGLHIASGMQVASQRPDLWHCADVKHHRSVSAHVCCQLISPVGACKPVQALAQGQAKGRQTGQRPTSGSWASVYGLHQLPHSVQALDDARCSLQGADVRLAACRSVQEFLRCQAEGLQTPAARSGSAVVWQGDVRGVSFEALM